MLVAVVTIVRKIVGRHCRPSPPLSTPWMILHGERLLDNQGQELDYWRVEKEDSAVIVTIVGDDFVLPQPVFRPGLGSSTLDFPGREHGRVLAFNFSFYSIC